MAILYHDQPPNSSKRCKFFSSVLKDVFFNCHTCKRNLSFSSRDEEDTHSIYFNDEEEVVSIIKARAMEAKFKRKSIRWDESFSSVFYPVTLSELFVRSTEKQENRGGVKETNGSPTILAIQTLTEGEGGIKPEEIFKYNEEKEEFLSVASHFSCCSCAASDASEFFSVKTSLSQCLSLEELEMFPELKRRSVIHEFSHCKGWPFGLCRRAMLLPPLPKSPSDSWSWCKRTKFIKTI